MLQPDEVVIELFAAEQNPSSDFDSGDGTVPHILSKAARAESAIASGFGQSHASGRVSADPFGFLGVCYFKSGFCAANRLQG